MSTTVSAAGSAEPATRSTLASVRITGEKRALTGLPGVAACLVMLYHFTSGKIGGPVVLHGYTALTR